jgi:inosine-uridine nucleoside N-ribohydrolase
MLSPEFRVRGIVTTHAPNLASTGQKTVDEQGVPIPEAAITKRVVLDVLNHMPLKKLPPVIEGASLPMFSRGHPNLNPGVTFILDQSRSFKPNKRLTIVVIGAATDLASALLDDPSLEDRIEVVALGFDSWPKGTDRFNVKNDVSAWQVLFDANLPLTIADCQVAIRDLYIDDELAGRILGSHGSLGKYLEHLVKLERTPDVARQVTGRTRWPVWDEATVAYLLGFAKSAKYSRPRLLDDTTLDHHPHEPERSITWVTSIDSQALWSDLAEKLAKSAD